MIKIILSGCLGQMGQMVTLQASRRNDLKIVAGLDKNTGKTDYDVYANPSQCPQIADVLIDFSHPSAIEGITEFCVSRNMPMVICTTGLTAKQNEFIVEAAKRIPVLQSSNMSIGVLFLHKLIKLAAKELYGRFDIEIIESHHNQKLDAPSGTANALFNTAKSAVPALQPVYDRHSYSKKREKNEVGMHSVRGGGIVGKHEVVFAGENECITLSHEAFSKGIFAAGALDAAVFLSGKPAGLYVMDDLFKE